MAVKIVFQAVCYQFPLGDGRDAVGHVLLYLGQQQREVRAAQNDGVYLRVFGQQVADVFAYEVVSTLTLCLIVFYEGYPIEGRLHRSL